jgi:hypothetical protein
LLEVLPPLEPKIRNNAPSTPSPIKLEVGAPECRGDLGVSPKKLKGEATLQVALLVIVELDRSM